MARITTFIICDAIDRTVVNDEDKFLLVAPKVALRPLAIPTEYTFGMCIGIRGLDMNNITNVKCELYDPDGNVVFTFDEVNIPPRPTPDCLPTEVEGLTLTIDIRNMLVNKEGIYSVKMRINNEEMAAQEIPVYLQYQAGDLE